MAGIGFQLRKLNRQDSISSVLSSIGHAAVIVAGPWLFTIFSLATISLMTERVAGLDTLASFRAIVIYAFAVSLVLTAPVTIVATRRVADALWLRRPDLVRPLLLAGCLLALPPVALGVGALVVAFALPAAIAVTMLATSLLVALIWVALCFCGAIRDYRGVTLSFLVGLLASMLTTVAAAVAGFGPAGMVWGFAVGLLLTFLGLTRRVLATFPHAVTEPGRGFADLLGGFKTYWTLALGALVGTAGVWIDKWVFWIAATGERVEVGLLHAPLYDSAMFIASLLVIPALSTFVMKLETDFFERYQQYYATISSHGTLAQIESARERLARFSLENLAVITIGQVGICVVMVMIAPVLVEALNLQFRQVSILRYGAIGSVFQFILIASTSLLLFFDRRRRYLWVQSLFFSLNLGLSMLTVWLGEDYYGVGYFAACLITSLVAWRMADATFTNLNFLTFIGNNPSIGASVASGARQGRLANAAAHIRGRWPLWRRDR